MDVKWPSQLTLLLPTAAPLLPPANAPMDGGNQPYDVTNKITYHIRIPMRPLLPAPGPDNSSGPPCMLIKA